MSILILTAVCFFQNPNPDFESLINKNLFSPTRTAAFLPEVMEFDETTWDADALKSESSEEEVAQYALEMLAREAKNAGLTFNSINIRKTKVLDEATGLKELRIYFGYDAELPELVQFFQGLNRMNVVHGLSTLTISTRKRPSKRSSEVGAPMKQLNGNAIISILYPYEGDETSLSQVEGMEYFSRDNKLVSILSTLNQSLTEDSYLIHLQIKDGSQLRLIGESSGPSQVELVLGNDDAIEDLTAVSASTSTKNREGKYRFRYNARINFAVL